MTKTMNEQQFIKFYMNLKRSGKSDKEIERIITKWQTEGDEDGVKLVLVQNAKFSDKEIQDFCKKMGIVTDKDLKKVDTQKKK